MSESTPTHVKEAAKPSLQTLAVELYVQLHGDLMRWNLTAVEDRQRLAIPRAEDRIEALLEMVKLRGYEEAKAEHLPQPSEEKMIKYSDGKEYRLIDVLAGLANQLTPYAYDLNPRLVKETNEALAVWRDRKFLLPQPPEQKEKV